MLSILILIFVYRTTVSYPSIHIYLFVKQWDSKVPAADITNLEETLLSTPMADVISPNTIPKRPNIELDVFGSSRLWMVAGGLVFSARRWFAYPLFAIPSTLDLWKFSSYAPIITPIKVGVFPFQSLYYGNDSHGRYCEFLYLRKE